MSEGPTFDEIIGAEPAGPERERLREVHELLVAAGPPAEVTPRLAAGPALDEVRVRQLRRIKRRSIVLLAAALSVGALFGIGYGIGSSSSSGAKGSAPIQTLALEGTHAAPHAQATLQIGHEVSGNWPMTLTVSGLPKLPGHALYEVYLVRNGKPWGSCGTFVASGSPVTVPLNAPYRLQKGDSWIVTRESSGTGLGTAVLRPV